MKRTGIVDKIASKIKELSPDLTTILYGSEARGDARLDSDIDILILIPDDLRDEYSKLRSKLADELYYIELEHNVIISPLILMQNMWVKRKTPFTENIRNEGIMI